MYKGRIAALAAALLLVVSMVLVGCGQSGDTDSKIVLKVLAYGDNSQKEGQDWKRVVSEFEAANPNIDIDDEMLYDEAYHQKAKARLAAKDYPHVAYMGADERWAREWSDAGQQVDITSLLDPEYYNMDLIPKMGPNGEIWEVPLGTSNICTVLFVNTELLAKYGADLPKSYEDMVKLVAPASADGIEVVAMAGADAWVWNSCLLSGVVARMAGDANWVQKAVEGTYKFTDKAFVDSLAFIKKMLDDGVLSQSTILTDYGAAMSKFSNGQAIFFLQGQWAAGSLFDVKTDPDALKKQEHTKLMAFPVIPGEASNMTNSVAAAIQVGYGVTKAGMEDPKVRDAAVSFIKWVNAEQNALQRLKDGAIVAPILKNYTLPSDLEPIIKEKVRFASEITTITNVVDSYLPSKPNDALNAGMQNMAVGKTTPEQIAADVEKLVRE